MVFGMSTYHQHGTAMDASRDETAEGAVASVSWGAAVEERRL